MSDPIEALRRSFLTTGLSDDELSWLASRTQRRHYGAGSTIFAEGDPGHSLFVVIVGEVRITRMSATGQPLTLDTLYASDAFGGLALLDGARRSATATAVVDTDVVALHRDDFMQLIHQEPTALAAVLHNLADMIRSMNEKLDAATHQSAAVRVAKQLLSMAERHGAPGEAGGTTIRHPLTYADLASLTGLYSAEVERILEQYQYDRVVERGPEYWTILRPEVLRDATDGPLRRGD